MRLESGFRAGGRCREPGSEIAHQRRNFGRGGEHERRSSNRALVRAVAAGLLGIDAGDDQPMDLANVDFAYLFTGCGERAGKTERIAVPERLKMVLERLAADRDAFFEHDRGLAAAERVAL